MMVMSSVKQRGVQTVISLIKLNRKLSDDAYQPCIQGHMIIASIALLDIFCTNMHG